MLWRINFGNGQVHECTSRKECERLLALQFNKGGALIQRYVGYGEWRTVR